VRRFATAVPTVAATVIAVVTLSTGTALAHGPQAEHRAGPHKAAESHAKPVHVKPLITLTGVLSDTPTATVATPGSDTATSTITITVKGGERSLHRAVVVLTVDKSTVVRRGDGPATAADLRRGDHVSVRARRMPDGSWLALRVNASARGRED
jgi:hypothetical protein